MIVVKLWVLRGKREVGIFSKRILSSGGSSRNSPWGCGGLEGQLSTEPVGLCFDSNDGGVEGARGRLTGVKFFSAGVKSPGKTALAAQSPANPSAPA